MSEIYLEIALPHRGNFAEGTIDGTDKKPSFDLIKDELFRRGYKAKRIIMEFDDMQCIWKFIAVNLEKGQDDE